MSNQYLSKDVQSHRRAFKSWIQLRIIKFVNYQILELVSLQTFIKKFFNNSI